MTPSSPTHVESSGPTSWKHGRLHGRAMTLTDAVHAFLANGDACGHRAATRTTYAGALGRFQVTTALQNVADLSPEVIEHYLADLRSCVRPVSAHQAYRTLRTFTRWCARTGRLVTDPMAGLVMRAPKTLPCGAQSYAPDRPAGRAGGECA